MSGQTTTSQGDTGRGGGLCFFGVKYGAGSRERCREVTLDSHELRPGRWSQPGNQRPRAQGIWVAGRLEWPLSPCGRKVESNQQRGVAHQQDRLGTVSWRSQGTWVAGRLEWPPDGEVRA